MTTTIFLRFPDQGTFEALLPAGAMAMGETFDRLPAGIEAISVIGTIYSGGTYAPDGTVLTAPTAVPGYLVNVIGVLPAAWTQYQIAPVPGTPVRVFGG